MLTRVLHILPVSDLRLQAREALRMSQSEPVVITQNGRPNAVLLNYKSYNALLDRLAKLEAQESTERAEWAMASQAALARVWDNASDAAYDDWRELYGA